MTRMACVAAVCGLLGCGETAAVATVSERGVIDAAIHRGGQTWLVATYERYENGNVTRYEQAVMRLDGQAVAECKTLVSGPRRPTVETFGRPAWATDRSLVMAVAEGARDVMHEDAPLSAVVGSQSIQVPRPPLDVRFVLLSRPTLDGRLMEFDREANVWKVGASTDDLGAPVAIGVDASGNSYRVGVQTVTTERVATRVSSGQFGGTPRWAVGFSETSVLAAFDRGGGAILQFPRRFVRIDATGKTLVDEPSEIGSLGSFAATDALAVHENGAILVHVGGTLHTRRSGAPPTSAPASFDVRGLIATTEGFLAYGRGEGDGFIAAGFDVTGVERWKTTLPRCVR